MMSTRFLSFPHLSVTISQKMKKTTEEKESPLLSAIKTHTDANAEGDYNFREAVYWGDDRATGTNKLTSFACVDLPMIQYGLEGDAEFLGFKDVTRG